MKLLKILVSGKNGYLANFIKKYGEKKKDCTVKLVSLRNGVDNISMNDFQTIIHTSALVHQNEKKYELKDYLEINNDMTVNFAKKAKEQGVKQFVFISTMAVYGLEKGEINYSTSKNPSTFYGISKMEAEKNLRNLESDDFKIAIVRPPMIYGENAPGNFQYLNKIARSFPLFPMVDNKRSMIHIDNLTDFIFQLAENSLTGTFHPQDSDYINTSEMVMQLAAARNKKIYMSRVLGGIVKILFRKTKVYQKAFGDLYYSKELSEYEELSSTR